MNEMPRTCSKCTNEESTECPFPPTGNQCKQCLKDYNTVYQRNRRGHKARSEKLTPEQRHQNKIDSNKRWRKGNPEQAKKSDEKLNAAKRTKRKAKSIKPS